MKKIFIENLGCERRSLDAKRLCKYFSLNGYKITNNPKKADKIIFITCAFVDSIADICLDETKRLKEVYDSDLIVGGCLPAIEKEKLSIFFNGDSFETKNIDKIDSLFPENKVKFKDINGANILFENVDVTSPFGAFKNIFYKLIFLNKLIVKTQDYIFKHLFNEKSLIYSVLSKNIFYICVSVGCNGNCSYCAIKKAIGVYKSKPIEKCISEFKDGLKRGYKIFIIASDDVGSYGLDKSYNLIDLLDNITILKGDYKIILHDFNPVWLVRYHKYLEKILKRNKIIRLEVAIQSASSRILKLMNRYSDIKNLEETLLDLKRKFPDVALTTDYIIGFPTETEGEMIQTLDFIKNVGFDSGYIMPFSLRSETLAEKIEPKLSQKEIDRRFIFAKKYMKKAGYRIFSPYDYFTIFDNFK